MKYQYKMTVEQENTSLDYTIKSNDDAFSILEGLRAHTVFDDNACAAFVFGLKSIGFAMISHKDTELVSKLMQHFTSLMKEMKKELSHTKAIS
ncbi:MAG: DUF3861 family protein [Pseudomonadota bacterium]